MQESLECVLATSRRGGRRPRKAPRPLQSSDNFSTQHSRNDEGRQGTLSDLGQSQTDQTEETRHSRLSLQHSSKPPALTRDLPASESSDNTTRHPSVSVNGDVEGQFTSRDLLNPSDALNLLAQVADLDVDPGGHNRRSSQSASRFGLDQGHIQDPSGNTPFYYPPISDGFLDISDASYLLTQ